MGRRFALPALALWTYSMATVAAAWSLPNGTVAGLTISRKITVPIRAAKILQND